jgi:hypothetical protein
MRSLIIDDEESGRERLRRMLSAHPDIVIAGEARDGVEAVPSHRRHPRHHPHPKEPPMIAPQRAATVSERYPHTTGRNAPSRSRLVAAAEDILPCEA